MLAGRREDHIRPEIGVCQALQQLGRTALRDPRRAADDEILGEPVFVHDAGFDRQPDPWIAPRVAQLQPIVQVTVEDLVPVEADPHHADLRAPVLVDRDEVRGVAGFNRRPRRTVQRAHAS